MVEQIGDTGGDNPLDIYEILTAGEYKRVCEYALESDAHLIAAAPDLLASLKELLAINTDTRGDEVSRARAVIALSVGAMVGFEMRDAIQREHDKREKMRPRPTAAKPVQLIPCTYEGRLEHDRICRARLRSMGVGK